jgi:hypothetical protein
VAVFQGYQPAPAQESAEDKGRTQGISLAPFVLRFPLFLHLQRLTAGYCTLRAISPLFCKNRKVIRQGMSGDFPEKTLLFSQDMERRSARLHRSSNQRTRR